MNEPEAPLTFEEACQFLSLKPGTVRTLTRSGDIPSRKIGYTILYLRSELIEWLCSQPLRNQEVG